MTTIFRNDDLNPNSDLEAVRAMYATIRECFPDARIISAVNLLAQTSKDGFSYAALKPKDIKFHALDRMMDLSAVETLREISEIASHGIAHLDHRAVGEDLNRFSILASCSLLKAKIFVPPFLRWNQHSIDVCENAGIEFMGHEDGWINLDNVPARRGHDLFCFHSWKFTPETFAARFKGLDAR